MRNVISFGGILTRFWTVLNVFGHREESFRFPSEGKDKFLIAERELLSEGCPVGDITVRKIARRAGVGIGMVKYHFQTKDKQEIISTQIANLTAELVPGEGMGARLSGLCSFPTKRRDLRFNPARYSAYYYNKCKREEKKVDRKDPT